MIELVGTYSGDLLGIEYSEEERATAVAAVALYVQHLVTGVLIDDSDLVRDGLAISESVYSELSRNEPVISTETHIILRDTYLTHLSNVFLGAFYKPTYASFCNNMAVKPFEFAFHGMTATDMIDETKAELRFIG